MLVQFKMKNVLSFKEETIFDMTAISAYKEHPSNLIDIDKKEKFLRVAAIYGANASGKSNFVWALKLFRRIVSQSLNNVDDETESVLKKYSRPFSFEENKGNSEFEIVLILVVLIGLVIIFKNQLNSLIQSLLDKITKQSSSI